LNFSGAIAAHATTYDVSTSKPNIQVVDLRGSSAGWKLEAKVSEFHDKLSLDPSLQGAVIHIENGVLDSTTSASYAPTHATDIELSTDNTAKRIITANPGKGNGLWVDRLYKSGDALVTLEVPTPVAEASVHQATITWTLSDTP
jgi:hypothetical protein